MSRDIQITEYQVWILHVSKRMIHVLDDEECPLMKGQFLRESVCWCGRLQRAIGGSGWIDSPAAPRLQLSVAHYTSTHTVNLTSGQPAADQSSHHTKILSPVFASSCEL